MWYGVWYELCAFLGFRIVVDYVKNSCWLHNLRARRNWNSSLMNFNHFNKSAKKSLKFPMSPTMSPIWSPKWMLPVPPQQSKVNHWVLYWESSVNWPSFFCGNPVHLQNELLCSRFESLKLYFEKQNVITLVWSWPTKNIFTKISQNI